MHFETKQNKKILFRVERTWKLPVLKEGETSYCFMNKQILLAWMEEFGCCNMCTAKRFLFHFVIYLFTLRCPIKIISTTDIDSTFTVQYQCIECHRTFQYEGSQRLDNDQSYEIPHRIVEASILANISEQQLSQQMTLFGANYLSHRAYSKISHKVEERMKVFGEEKLKRNQDKVQSKSSDISVIVDC